MESRPTPKMAGRNVNLGLKEKVLGAVESSGPPLCSVSLSKGSSENRVLLPATTFERLADHLQISRVNEPKKPKPKDFMAKAYRVVGKPQDVNQLAKRFAYPADRATRERELQRPLKNVPHHSTPKGQKEALPGPTSKSRLAKAPHGSEDGEAGAGLVDWEYCHRHKPQHGLLPSHVRDSIGFPVKALAGSTQRLQKARSGESQISALDPDRDLAEVLPVLGLYDPNARVPYQCGLSPLELGDGFASTTLTSPLALASPLGAPSLDPASPSAASVLSARVTLGSFFSTQPLPKGLAYRGASGLTPGGGAEAASPTALRLPPLAASAGAVATPFPREDTDVLAREGAPTRSANSRLSSWTEDGSMDVIQSSLFANDFQGMRYIIQCLEEQCPWPGRPAPPQKRASPVDAPHDDPAPLRGAPWPGHPSPSPSPGPGDREADPGEGAGPGPARRVQCPACVQQKPAGRGRQDLEEILASPVDKEAVVSEWKGMFVHLKLGKRSHLSEALHERTRSRDLVYKSPDHLGRVAQKASVDASNWSRARNFGVGHKSGTGVHSCSIWREAGERLHTHQDQRENSILFYHRLMLFLDIIKCPQTDTQAQVVARIRNYLLNDGLVQRPLLFQMLLDAGPSVLESRDSMKIVHFVRLELRVSLEDLINWIKKEKEKDHGAGWKLTSDLMAMWDKIKTDATTGAKRAPKVPALAQEAY